MAGREAPLAALTDSVRAVARTSDRYEICIPALQRWARFFHDPHITGPWQAAPPGPAPAANALPPAPAPDDPDRPALEFPDDSSAYLRLPSFDPAYKPLIDSLIGAHGPRLRATPYLIVDVRGNRGGYTGAYDSLTPLIATNPVHFFGQDVLASPANIAWYETESANPLLTAADRSAITALVARMRRHVGRLVAFTPDTVVAPGAGSGGVLPLPGRVAVLVDSGCASSCEDLVLAARQSAKVTVIGTSRTAGVLDYGEVRGVWLPGWRRVAIPTARSRGPRIDNVGIAPEVLVPAGTADPVAFARRYLGSHPAGRR